MLDRQQAQSKPDRSSGQENGQAAVQEEIIIPAALERAPASLSLAPPARFTKRFMSAMRSSYRLTSRRISSSLARRIVLLNVAGLVAMLLGFLWLIQTRESVIDARVQSLSTQAEIIAAAIASSASVETGSIRIDPEKLLSLQAGETLDLSTESTEDIDFSLNPERVAPVLRRLVKPTRTRARVFDQVGAKLLDTLDFYSPGGISRANLPAPDESSAVFQRTWNSFKRRFGRTSLTGEDEISSGRFPEVQQALSGAETSLVRVNTEGQTIVYVAVPIQRFKSVPGVLLLSTQEGDVDGVIAAERLSIFMVFLIAAGVMTVLSFLLAGTIAEPVRKLAEAAERVRRGTNTRQEIPDFSDRSDEIGHLSVALREMTKSLYNRIEAIESFAADVAHELKNPLTSLRSAVETVPLARNDESRKRLLDVIEHDVKRLDRLISDISDASRLDADLQRNDKSPVDVARLLDTLVGIARDTPNERKVHVVLDPVRKHNKHPQTGGHDQRDQNSRNVELFVYAHDSRIGQVISNLIDNAISFSPIGGTVHVTLRALEDEVEICVEDQGPGIPEHALERIFERFYTDRPEQGFGQNSGLGLSISRQIIAAHRGRIWAENRYGDGKHGQSGAVTGARFIVRLPGISSRDAKT